ncbi:MAG: hypothetical protein COA99_00865 [Moraxellaceae bacterium]|nr:MAG: hypothetical protein COA99_00865 [Moraxellaceae bacterium]
MNDQIDVSTAIILPIAKLCMSLGVGGELLQPYIEGLNLSDVDGSGIPAGEVGSLIEMLYAETGREDLGFLLGDLFEFEYTPEFTTYYQSAGNIGELMESANWLGQFFSANLQLTFENKDDEVALYLPPMDVFSADESPRLRRMLVEGVFTYILKRWRGLLGEDLPITITMSHADPGIEDAYNTYFCVPCEFNSNRDAIVAPSSILDMPLQGAIPALNEKARESLQKKLDKIQSTRLTSTLVLNILRDNSELLACNIDTMAEYLHLGERTLQRRLQKEGTNFFQLQDQAKQQLAIELLKSNRYSIEQISDQLGFSDRRSFSRAFQRWQGCSPRQFKTQAK